MICMMGDLQITCILRLKIDVDFFFNLNVFFGGVILKAQSSRSLPGKAMYSKKPPAIDPYPGLYHTVKSWSVSKGLLSRKGNE